MAKLMIALAVVSLATIVSAKFDASCKGVEQISFTAMEQEDNQCHFLVKEGQPEKMDSSSMSDYDKLQTCACNLVNKRPVWKGMNGGGVPKLNHVIDNRLFISEMVDKVTMTVDSLLAMPEEELQHKLTSLPDSFQYLAERELTGSEVKSSCMQLVEDFGKFNKMLQNLDAFAGSSDVTKVIVAKNNELKQIKRAFEVCKKANFSN